MSKAPITLKVEEAQEKLVVSKDALIASTIALDAAPDEEVLLIQVEELTDTVEKQAKTLAALQKAEVQLAATAVEKAVDDDKGTPALALNLNKYRVPDMAPGDLLFKMATANVVAHVQKKPVQQIMQESYKDMPVLGEISKMLDVRKTGVNPALTSTPGWAQELVQTDVRGYIDTLKDISVAAALSGYAMSLDFGGYNSLTIPRRVPKTGVQTEPSWVAEGSPIPLTQYQFGSMVLNRYKLAAITTMSKEVAERSMPSLEGILRDALRESHAQVLDAALLSAVAMKANVRPAGLLDGVTLTTGIAGGGDAAVRGDIMALLSKMIGNKVGARPILICNNMDRLSASMMTSALSEYLFKDELASGQLMSLPVISSANVPQHTLIMVDAQYVATAFDVPDFEVSDVATVIEANADITAPTMASTAAGAAGTAGEVGPGEGIPVSGDGRPLGAADAGFTARSLWQTYSLGIRMIAPTSWGIMQPNVVEASKDTSWS